MLLDYCHKNGIEVDKQDCKNVVRRLDLDGDGKVGYAEWKEAFVV